MAALSQSMVENDDVTMRAITAGTTRAAAISVTPMTFIVARIDAASTSMSRASMRATGTPDASATSGSKVTKRRDR